MYEIAVMDYGVGNLLSVRRALEYCGATVTVTADHDILLASPRVILPGVGAFPNGMNELRRQGLDEIALEIAARGIPLLGICLGMQMLLDESEEFDVCAGLGLIPGKVVPVPPVTSLGLPQKIPHIGWNSLELSAREGDPASLLRDVKPSEAVYFVHSFMAEPADSEHRIADCRYGGVRVAAVIGRENVLGCQFHPEKSGVTGLKILRAFLARSKVSVSA
jgi:imidazole glycerol-phosphate synthase subunit HisH